MFLTRFNTLISPFIMCEKCVENMSPFFVTFFQCYLPFLPTFDPLYGVKSSVKKGKNSEKRVKNVRFFSVFCRYFIVF